MNGEARVRIEVGLGLGENDQNCKAHYHNTDLLNKDLIHRVQLFSH